MELIKDKFYDKHQFFKHEAFEGYGMNRFEKQCLYSFASHVIHDKSGIPNEEPEQLTLLSRRCHVLSFACPFHKPLLLINQLSNKKHL